jgi:2-polyprenyl-3-methyl-5-hydroxy-6-metoxy-1,4-benzoquinol methylase
MKLGHLPETPLEAAALAGGLVPTPLLDTLVALLLAQTVLTATRLGVFEALEDGPLCAEEVAARCAADPDAMEKLLGALAGAGYLSADSGRYTLSSSARKWLLKDSPHSLHDAILYQAIDGEYIARMEEYVRTGTPLRIHAAMGEGEWKLYQRAMYAGAGFSVAEFARRIPVPRGARTLLDIGGAHGRYAVALCERHPGLRATILDLPDAVREAAPLVARSGLSERVTYRVGDALTFDLGEDLYDIVIINNLVHHFDEAANRALTCRVARALRPGGVVAIGEVIRSSSTGKPSQVGALTDLYFALTSEAGTWSFAEMASWQRDAGLIPRRGVRLLTAPGGGLQIARKPQSDARKGASHDATRPERPSPDGAGAHDRGASSRTLGG